MIRILGLLLVIILLSLFGSVVAFELYHAERIYPDVWVWDVDVSGMRVEEATVALADSLELDAPLVTLHGPEQSWSLRPTDLGLQIDPYTTLASAYQLGRSGSFADNVLSHFWLLIYRTNLPPIAVYDERVARLYLKTLAEQIDFSPTNASLAIDGITPVANSAQSGRRVDVEATLAALTPAVLSLVPTEVELVIHEIPTTITDSEQARAEAETLLDGPLTLVLAEPLENDPEPRVIQPEQLAEMLVVQVEDGVLHVSLDEKPLRTYVETLAPALVIESEDARFHFNDWTGELEPIISSQDGRVLDVGASVMHIMQELATGNHRVPLVVQDIPPPYPDSATAEELGIVELVAQGDSYFIGSPSGRDHNIRLARGKFDGVVIGPGETFSFNHYLGPVTAEAGYDESYVTAGEQLAIEVGGGICQVSTTAFRAAFFGGYPIVERWYHQHRVGYYELMGAGLGMDATVYSPHVDFKFVNDQPYPLLIEAEIEEAAHRLLFRFYSTSDGRQVEKDGPTESDRMAPGPPIYQLYENMAPNTVIQWQSAVNGVTATIGRQVYDAAGNLISHDFFVSKYSPRRASYHHGPGYEPPGEETESEKEAEQQSAEPKEDTGR